MAKSETKSAQRPVDEGRARLAQVVEIATLLIALVLVVGAVLVAFRGSINADNTVVQFVKDVAATFDGPFSRRDGVFDFGGQSGDTRDALANWGLAAALYLVVGRIAGRIIRP